MVHPPLVAPGVFWFEQARARCADVANGTTTATSKAATSSLRRTCRCRFFTCMFPSCLFLAEICFRCTPDMSTMLHGPCQQVLRHPGRATPTRRRRYCRPSLRGCGGAIRPPAVAHPDAAARRHHGAADRPCAAEHGRQVQVDDALPLLVGELQ